MKFQQLRNATCIVELDKERILVDPMLSAKGAVPGLMLQPGFRLLGRGLEKRANPLVDLPSGAAEALETVTAALITHTHPDHLDGPGIAFLKEKQLPIYASGIDAPGLLKKGLNAHELKDGDLGGLRVELVPATHGHGILGYSMGPGVGFFLCHPKEPSVYITGDTILSTEVREAISRLSPDVVIAPAGSANVGLGYDILFSVQELLELRRLATGQVIFNHMEALDHCTTTRAFLREELTEKGLMEGSHIPGDGDMMYFGDECIKSRGEGYPDVKATKFEPGFQKWLTSWLG